MKLIYFFIFLLLVNNAFGFGVSPSNFELNLNNGDVVEKEFFIYNNENDNKYFNVTNYNYLEFLNFTDFIVNADANSEKEVKFLINIPYETEEGNYNGRIYLKELNNEEGGIFIDTLLGIKLNIKVKSNFTLESKEDSYNEKIFLHKAGNKINPDEVNKLSFLKYFKEEPELMLFYSLIALVLLLCTCRILIKLIYKE